MPGYVPFSLAGLSGRVVGSVQGSAYLWDTTAPAGFKDSSRALGLGTTYATGLSIENTTTATSGVPVQCSPVLALGGTARETTGGTSVQHWYGWVQVPNSSAASSPGLMRLVYKSGAGAWTNSGFTVASSGGANAAWFQSSSSLSNVFTQDSIGDGGATAYTSFLVGRNTSTPGTGLRQESPALIWQGRVSDGATAWGQQFACKLYPSSAATPTAALQFGFRQESGASTPTGNFSTVMSLTSGGALSPVQGVCFPAMTVAAPITATAVGQVVYVSDGDAGAKCLAMWDGANWLRIVLGTAIAAS